MHQSLFNSIRLLGLCTILLIVAIVILILAENKSVATDVPQEKKEASLPDPSKMDSASLAIYTNVQEGEKLFKEAGCNSCHTVCEKLTGPALHGVTKRRKKEWIYQAVTNFSKLRKSGDATSETLYQQYKIEMPNQEFVKKEWIDKILVYVESGDCNK